MSVCLSVCVLGTLVSPAKIVHLIEMPIGEQIHVGPRNYVLDEVHHGAIWQIW